MDLRESDDDDDEDDDEDEEEDESEKEDEEQDETAEEEDEEVSEDNENSSEDDEAAGRKMLRGKLTSKTSAEVKGILKEPTSSDRQEKKKTVNFGEKSKVEETKKKESGALTEDIYGRLRDKQGNVVKESSAFVPPGRRFQHLQQRDGEGLEMLKVQISRIINR